MIQISPAARDKIQSLVDAEVVRDPALRVTLAPDTDRRSPLEGRPYVISLVEREDKEKTEIAINVDGIRVFLNLDTSNLLSGATVGWEEGSGFRVATPEAPRPAARPEGSAPSVSGPLAERVQALFDEMVNPRIASHGGAVELVDVDGDAIYIRMTGGCQGCAASAATLRMGIERTVREELPEVGEIIDITDHAAGVNPYF
jgi:Fe-S cluster biogenesis protein NfuA/Fe-S cluster assembly iron-binding protein IscA